MTEADKMHNQSLYNPGDPAIAAVQVECLEKLYDYNHTRPSEAARRTALLEAMFADIGKDCYLEPPFHSNFGGHHVHLGDGVYANFNLTLVDDTHITIGSRTMIGPNVTIATAGHPILPELRARGLQYNAPVFIGENCWLGAGVIVLPGVTIGDNVVIGAGSVVTHDLPSNVVAFGDPCKIARPINDHDRDFYFKNHRIDPAMLN
ncbi:sugar O-acetyltransferase [Lacticaseibacillus kribbianus]|uniref:sugar O-acetyltransferase n=1 Tax=Lacticaseibacillus kribbianus TaxID=2926292 RepID=UPI001CD67747|nr:sugar O-acetyltransferase [Lacticaseibacillus kribbianus]